jgi:transglutaminase-like putative cysteine protease
VLFEVRQRYRYTYTQPVSDVRQRLVMVPPAWHGDQRVVSYNVDVRGARTGCEMSWESDRFGNRVCTVYAGQVEQALDFVATFRVERSRDGVAGGWGMPPNGPGADMLSETALTAADDRLRAIAAEIAGQTSSPRRRAELAAEWAAGAITYRIGVTGVQTPAAMALHLGQGVCQDYAHILLSVLRSMGVPGRYVSGQLPGEGVPHAWAEAILPLERGDGVEVVAYDPTHRRRTGIEYITVAVGRDFADVTPTSGYFSGPAGGRLSAEKRADVVDVDYQVAGAADEAAA